MSTRNTKFSLEAFDSAECKRALFKDALDADFLYERFEFYYLPGALPYYCVEYYRAEMEERGVVWEDLERLEKA